jgi:hypothetical protein
MKNEFLILSNDRNRALAISIINDLEKHNIPYKETNKGIVVLMNEEEFNHKFKKIILA